MVCLDTLDLGFPIPDGILEQREYDLCEVSDEYAEECARDVRYGLLMRRRRMLRIARGPCPIVGMNSGVGRQRGRTDPFWEIAYHEAGHAIACAALGTSMSRACIIDLEQYRQYRSGDQESFLPACNQVGHVLHSRDLRTLEGATAAAFIAAAGPAAELIVGGLIEDFAWGEPFEKDGSLAQSDVGLMTLACHVIVCNRIGAEADFRATRRARLEEHNRIWKAVCRFLADKRALTALDRIAGALKLHGSLRGAEIVHIAERHGVMDVPELAELHLMPGRLADAA